MVDTRKITSLLRFGIGVMCVVVVNQLLAIYPFRIDLTEEQRYSLSPATKQLLEALQEPVYVEVFLEGELPSGFKRLRNGIEATLQQFDYYAQGRIKYNFKDPSLAQSKKAKNEYFKSLIQRGLQPTNLSYKRDGNNTEKLIFPGAIISYFGRELPVTLLKGNQVASAEERLNQSLEGLEYNIANVIRMLSTDRKKNIGLIKNHGIPDSLNLAGLTHMLQEKYNVFNLDIAIFQSDLSKYDAVVFPKPTTSFSPQEKYKIDQYIMHGGKTLFFVDALRVNMDSASGEGTFAFPYSLNLDDLFFKYGVRINKDYVQDMVSGDYPVVAGTMGDQPQIRMLPWPFFPVINNFGKHSIVKNMDAVSMKFVSTIDTIKANGITKTPLLMTSPYTMVNQSPVRVAFNELRKNLDPSRFNHGVKNVAYLLEGEFTSLYKNRLLPKDVPKKGFVDTGKKTSILVCADGDMIRNEFSIKDGSPLPLGISPYNQMQYANRDFVMNAIDYMLHEKGLILAKNKEITIRPLDKVKIASEKLKWQIINLVLPIIGLIVFGVVRSYIRKKKYANF